MKNDGKLLENTIRLVQETFKDSPNTYIYSNHKIANESGNKREFDLVIESKINDFDIRIVIECKDHKGPIAVGLIEAFNSKCARIRKINKKIFISRDGYQRDAIDAANSFDIELQTAEKVSKSTIAKWLTIGQLSLKITNEFTNIEIYIDPKYEIQKKLKESFNFKIYKKDNPNDINFFDFIFQNLKENSQIVNNLALYEWFRLPEDEKFEPFEIKFSISFENYFVKSSNGTKIGLQKIIAGLKVYYSKSEINLLDARKIKGSNNNEIARTISLDSGKRTRTDLIFKDDSLKLFQTDEKGITHPIKRLFTYNPKKDSFE
jgi:hypothetical protein